MLKTESINPISILREKGIDVNNFSRAITIAESWDYDKDRYEREFFEVTGVWVKTEFELQAKLFFINFVGDAVKQYCADEESSINTSRTIERAKQATEKYFSVMSRNIPTGKRVIWRPTSKEDTQHMWEQYKQSYTKPRTKQDRAIDIVKANPNLSNRELQELFVSQLNLTHNGAATYVYNVKKMLG